MNETGIDATGVYVVADGGASGGKGVGIGSGEEGEWGGWTHNACGAGRALGWGGVESRHNLEHDGGAAVRLHRLGHRVA